MAPEQQGQRPRRAVPRRTGGRRWWWHRLLAAGAERRLRRRAALALYMSVAEQARQPAFYRDWGVPDTPEGRFEVLALHAFFVLRRLRGLGEPGRELGQEVFDVMFGDLDLGLRELGVGDLSVGKHVKRYARFFYGRIDGLERALTAAVGDGGEGISPLEDVLRRNLCAGAGGGRPPGAAELAAFAAYVRAQDRHVAAQAADELFAGRVSFLPPASAVAGVGDGGAGAS